LFVIFTAVEMKNVGRVGFMYALCCVFRRESFRQERLKLTEEIEKIQNEFELAKVTLRKEIEYKETVEKSHHELLVEQQDLHIKLVY
jgi:hypothetical protein